MKKIICYVNQFFGGIGGEAEADIKPLIKDCPIGPAKEIEKKLVDAQVIKTVICGDNYIGSNTEEAIDTIIEMIKDIEFDIFIAGPAFNAGRYGVACGSICKAVKRVFDVEVYTSMYEENPGVELFKRDIIIFRGGNAASRMRNDIKTITDFINKTGRGEKNFGALEEGYFTRGCRHEKILEDKIENTAARRAISMLIKKINGEHFETELRIPDKKKISVAKPIEKLEASKIALITTGGIVPQNNPDKIQSASATRWGRYSIAGCDSLSANDYKTIHAGYDPSGANGDPNRVAPVDALRQYEREGRIKKLHDYFYSTVGTGTTEAEAKRMAKEIIPFLSKDNVDGIILTST